MSRADQRSAARLAIVQALYQMDVTGKGLNEILAEFESFWISGKNIFVRAPRISATQAARRCQRFRDFAQRKTAFVRAGLATTIGAIRQWTRLS